MKIFVEADNLILFQNNDSKQQEDIEYRTTSGDVAISIKKSFDTYEITIDERFCREINPTNKLK